MQVAGSAYPGTQPLYPYPNHYHHHHHPVPVARHDHELKRQYLTLLPPQQIIEICLTFDGHVPPYVKASIWPVDINAAIAGLRKQSAATPSNDAEAPKISPSTAEEDNGTIMDSLVASSSETSPAPESEQSKTIVEEPRPPDKEPLEEEEEEPPNAPEAAESPSTASTADNPAPQAPAPEPTPTAAATTPAHAPTPNASSTAETRPAPSAAHAQPMPVAYPHQPYGYPYAPYYPPPPPGYPYPHHHQYPGYPHQQQHYAPPPPAAMPPVPPPPAPSVPLMQDGQSPDDLPSYEEMIVEALMDTNDPEGCAPKDLFTWMAARYPVQSNFRPSASQALQKAYKRGRLEKSSNNKYRLNSAWEGGNTSRRTTRRPQTHTHTLAPSNPTPSSPFTNAPLVHHHQHPQQPQQQPQPYSGHPYSSYPYPQSAYPGYSAPPAAAPTQPAATSTLPSASEPKSADSQNKEANDAYEAAQSILKAINFGSLLQLPAEETQEGVAARDPQAQSGYQQAVTAAQPSTLLAALNGAEASPAPAPENGTNLTNSRAELQAQLALLAAQLAELARVDDATRPAMVVQGQTSIPAPVARQQEVQQHFFRAPPQQTNQQPRTQPPVASTSHLYECIQHQPSQPSVDLSVPMASLLPPPPPPALSISQTIPSQPSQPSQPSHLQPTPSHTRLVPQHQPNPQPQLQPQPPLEEVRNVPAAEPAPPPSPPIEQTPPASPGLMPIEPMDSTLDGEYDSEEDDDDMEEVI